MREFAPRRCGWVLAVLAILASACGSTAPERLITEEAQQEQADIDPIKGINRGFFNFNETLDRFFLKPVAIGWSWITPEYFRVHLQQMFLNLNFPGQLVNNLLQGEVKQAGRDVGRFVTNSTIGIAGFFDPATGWGMPTRDEDFGQTLGVWGLGAGSYLVLPFMGPSGRRDLTAKPIDWVLNVGSSPLLPGGSVRQINSRTLALEQIDEARKGALDFYVFARGAYRQNREAQVANDRSGESTEPDESLYELDEEEDE
ncbi:MAG: VacJ family lipoprotein [bacterium]|nr:VacJ family lipoprotein [bacterium]